MPEDDGLPRCDWAGPDPIYIAYHDTEWGVPEHDDQTLFEKLILDGFQAGLSWLTILKKRENFYRAFDDFDPETMARYDDGKVAALMADPGIIRNRAKIEATIGNARAYLTIMEEREGFAAFLWQFTDGEVRHNHWRSLAEVPAQTAESRAMSRALKDCGFRFTGPTICYAFMQAVGMVNDHLVDCFRHADVAELG